MPKFDLLHRGTKINTSGINVCFWKTAHGPLPKPNILAKARSVNVRFGEGWVGSFSEIYIDPTSVKNLLLKNVEAAKKTPNANKLT